MSSATGANPTSSASRPPRCITATATYSSAPNGYSRPSISPESPGPPLEHHHVERVVVLFVDSVMFGRYDAPGSLIDLRQAGVALDIRPYARQVNSICVLEEVA